MVALTNEQYTAIINAMNNGCGGLRKNPRISAILMMEANLGMRVGDILRMRLCDIVSDGGRFRLNMTEEKTGKKRRFSVPVAVYDFLRTYAETNGIAEDERLFPVTERAVQKHLKDVCDYLGIRNVSTHSFRKWYATSIYNATGHDIILVQHLLQHSSPTTTRRYIGIAEEKIESAIANHVQLIVA